MHAPLIGLDRTVLFNKAPRLKRQPYRQALNALLPQVEPLCNYTKCLARLVVDQRKKITIKDLRQSAGVSETTEGVVTIRTT